MPRKSSIVPAKFAILYRGESTAALGKYLCKTCKNAICRNMGVSVVCTFPISRDVELCDLCSPLVRGGDYNPAI